MTAKRLLRGFASFALLIVLGYAWQALNFGDHGIDEAWIDSAVRGHGRSGELLYIVAAALATAVGIPRQILSFLGGYAFGFARGSAWALAATCISCVVCFYAARWLVADTVRTRLTKRLQRVDTLLSTHSFLSALVVRLFPIGNNLATNLLAGVTHVRAAPFFAGSALGYLPQTAIFALAGSGIGVGQKSRIVLSAVLLLVSSALGGWLYKSYGAAKRANSTDAHALNP